MSFSGDKWDQARDIIRTIDIIQGRVVSGLSEDASMPALTPRQFTLLITVRNKGGASIKELAAALGVTASSASTMVERMVEGGILTREQNRADRREVIVRISSELEKIIEPLERGALRMLVDLIDKMGPEYARMWAAVHARIREVMAEEDSDEEDTQTARNGRRLKVSEAGA